MARARRADDRSWYRWAARLVAAAVLAVATGYAPYRLVGGAGTAQLERMTADLARTRAAIARRRRENAGLRRDIDALKNDPAAIEDIARRELGMVRPGERVLRFDSTPADREAHGVIRHDLVSDSGGDRSGREAHGVIRHDLVSDSGGDRSGRDTASAEVPR